MSVSYAFFSAMPDECITHRSFAESYILECNTKRNWGNNRRRHARPLESKQKMERFFTSRRLLLIGAISAMACLLGVLLMRMVLLPEKDILNFGTYRQIRLGMNEHQVRAIVGLPPGNYCDWVREDDVQESNERNEAVKQILQWRGQRYTIIVYVGENGLVNGKRLYNVVENEGGRSFARKLFDWLRGR
jgi:hypothetical protein